VVVVRDVLVEGTNVGVQPSSVRGVELVPLTSATATLAKRLATHVCEREMRMDTVLPDKTTVGATAEVMAMEMTGNSTERVSAPSPTRRTEEGRVGSEPHPPHKSYASLMGSVESNEDVMAEEHEKTFDFVSTTRMTVCMPTGGEGRPAGKAVTFQESVCTAHGPWGVLSERAAGVDVARTIAEEEMREGTFQCAQLSTLETSSF